ncbi:MAG: sigma 54-interacting transcriptional regulator [Syntrophales bacterium]|jgi:PAS domain S-box-containing protein|nr:sigma 54-interacting transcriptional regulator [Syntrophales bacterium]
MVEKKRDLILDSIADGVFTVDHDWRITSFNHAAEMITGVERSEAIGQLCKDVLKAEICEKDCAIRQTLTTGQPVVNKTVHIVNAEGQRIPISISTAVLQDRSGNVVGAVETFRDISVVETLKKEISRSYGFEDFISKNHRMHDLFKILPDISQSNATILIEGESGTGKELLAKAIHQLSLRKNKRLVVVNCGALPDTLLESEFFGYKAGAFTDAKRDKPGRFKLADKGTIFLDEIGDISPALQIRLLRVLQEGTYEPLGSVESCRTDVRVITATNRHLQDLVREGKFREDLYYRINVMRIELPPLRERKEDIPLLIEHFITHFNLLQTKQIQGMTDDALACLMSYDFPGNIRELKNIIEHTFILCKKDLIERQHLPESVRQVPPPHSSKYSEVMTFKDVEAIFLTNVLRRNQWNRIQTAKELGIHKSTLFRKIKSLGIVLPNHKRSH